MSAPSSTRVRRHPVVEVFGPTVQGEGPAAGRPCYFVRLGGCDFRCSWCDSMYAVEPTEVREHAERLTDEEINGRLIGLGQTAGVVVLSGGNPALHHLGGLVERLQRDGWEVHVETQGSVWRDWLVVTDQLVVSPKPPSSGMVNERHDAQFADFMRKAQFGVVALKIVVFDEVDYEWARAVHLAYRGVPFFLSVGTPQDLTSVKYPNQRAGMSSVRWQVCSDYAWLCECVAHDPNMHDVRVFPQLHVLAWGMARGV